MDKYTVIIGDLINSKQLSQRDTVQDKLKKTLESINQKYSEDIAADFMITLGDEFQGLLSRSTHLLEIILTIEKVLSPVSLRFGVGIGEVNTQIQRQKTAEIDGPAYHHARQMITVMKDRESQYNNVPTNILIDSQSNTDPLVNSTLAVCFALKSKWTDRQIEIINAYEENNENQYQTAKYLNIAQPNVSKTLSVTKYFSFKQAMENIAKFLQNF